jgi:hypothetical protein
VISVAGQRPPYQADRAGDVRQAWYFLRILGAQSVELDERLKAQRAQLVRYAEIGDLSATRRTQRLVRALEVQERTIDRLMSALKVRLSAPLDRGI